MIDEIRIASDRSAVDHLILVTEIHIEILIECLVDPYEEPVLVDSGAWPFAAVPHVIDSVDRIEVDKDFVITDERPVRSYRQGI